VIAVLDLIQSVHTLQEIVVKLRVQDVVEMEHAIGLRAKEEKTVTMEIS